MCINPAQVTVHDQTVLSIQKTIPPKRSDRPLPQPQS